MLKVRICLSVALLIVVACERTRAENPAAGSAPNAESYRDLLERAQEKSREGRPAEAVPLWQRVVQQNPVNGEYWSQLASALYNTKNYRESIAAYEKALELRAGYPANVTYNIACCHAMLGDKAQALHWLEKALNRGFRNLSRAQADSEFASLRSNPKYRELVALVDTSKMSRDEGWRFDLKLLAREIKRLHYNPFRFMTREQFDAQVQKLHEDIPRLKDGEIIVGFMKLVQAVGDGHTSIRPAGPIKALPVQLFLFEEGVFVTAAAPTHADLAGAEILKVGEHKTADALAALASVISRDNAMGLKAMGPRFLTFPRLLNGLGLIPDADKATFTVRDASGKERTVALTETLEQVSEKWVMARKDASLPAPLHLKNRRTAYWFEYVPESKLIYFQYNSVRNDGKESLEKFCERLFKFINENEVDRLVLDIRWNGGGNSFLNRPIVHGLVRCDKINQRGKLFVITGRNTFSAAQNCTTDLQMHTNALFVGEPTGSSPNFIGETIRFSLPYSKMEGSISDLLWQRSWPMDYRTWIAPQLYAPPSFALYKASRDPAVEAILAYSKTANATNPTKQ